MNIIVTNTSLTTEYYSPDRSSLVLPPESFELLTKAAVTIVGLLITGVVAVITKRYIAIN